MKLDKFYTKPEIARFCFNLLKEHITIQKNDILLEPSAGNGSFIKYFEDFKYEAYDIKPEGDNIKKQDFLTLETCYKDYITIGNPPFGHRNKLSIKFFNKAASMSKVIAFIIPNTFLKWSIQKQLNPQWKLIYTTELPKNSFLDGNNDYDINCIFQIWIRNDQEGNDLRLKKAPEIKCDDIVCWQYNATEQAKKFVYEDWDYAFWRQGYNNYNEIFTNKDRKEVERIVNTTKKQMFFVKCNNSIAHEIIKQMDLNKLAQSNLSTPGFGKADFVAYYLQIKKDFN